MTETNAYILDPEKLTYLIETFRYCQGSFERELQGLDHFLQGTLMEMARHVRHIEEKKAQAETELAQAAVELVQAEQQEQYAEANLKNEEALVAKAGILVGQKKEEREAAYDTLNSKKESMRGDYHPEYQEVISDCWDDINDSQKAVDQAYQALNEAKEQREQARKALSTAKHRVSECTRQRDKARHDVQKWTDRLPVAKDLLIQVRLLLENNYYASPSAFGDGGPDWKMTQIVDDTIPKAIKKLQAIIKAIEVYIGASVSAMTPMTVRMMNNAVQAESDRIYTEIRKGFRPNPAPARENAEIRCPTCGRRLKECICQQ